MVLTDPETRWKGRLMGDPEDLAEENFAASEYDHCLLRKL
jgi:hypothetical protein